ncbi:MAG: response regulator transcription factor [Gordonia amarae]
MRVLVVEDDPAVAETLRRVLTADGWNVVTAADGALGLARACGEHFDAVILDIMLPELNGFLVVRELRARNNWVPVLMLSAKDGEYDQAEALDYGADDYLVKPFSGVVLRAHLRAVARRGAQERPVDLIAGTLVLNPATRQVHRGGVRIELTSREFAVLEYLIRNRGRAVAKNAILRSVWDEFYEGSENIVEVYIRYLRKRIDIPFGVASIETVRGTGYRLVDA